jgi:hypothetical protein
MSRAESPPARRDAVEDLADRWRFARRASLMKHAPACGKEASEQELAAAALTAAPELALKDVFDHSRTLGLGFRNYYQLDLPLADLVQVLPRTAVPCIADSWTRADGEAAYIGRRSGCSAAIWHARACDYWKEAIDGLVAGLTATVRHARHTSLGAGQSECVDVLVVRPESPLRFGPIPDDLRAGLESVRAMASVFDSQLVVDFLGVSENVLYYLARPSATTEVRVSTVIERGIQRRFPWLGVREVSPRSVFTDGP